MPCMATQDKQVIVKSSDQTWVTGEGNGNPFQYSCLEKPRESMKRQKNMTPEDESPRSESVQNATGEGWRKISNTSSKDEVSGPQQKGCSAVDVSGGKSKGHAVKDSIASQVALVVKKPPANAGGIRDSG